MCSRVWKWMIDFLDLNKGWYNTREVAIFTVERESTESGQISKKKSARKGSEKTMTFSNQAWMFLGTLFGVLLSPGLKAAPATANAVTVSKLLSTLCTWQEVVFGVVVVLIIAPSVYKALDLEITQAPWIVRFGFFLQQGLSWPIIMRSVVPGG